MAKSGTASFEIQAEMRAIAEKSVEQARQAFDTFISAAQQAVTSAGMHVTGARDGAKEVGVLAVRLAERNIAASFEFAERLICAKDAQEAMALHAGYVKRQIAAFNEQAKELSKEAAKLAGSSTRH
jgi:phasin